MGSLHDNKSRIFTPRHHTPCTRTHHIVALVLVIITFFLAKLFDQSFSPCQNSSLNYNRTLQKNLAQIFDGGRSLSWPERWHGSYLSLSLKIYVYDESEIDVLKLLLYGRDGTISTDSCLKGQWGTQVNFMPVCMS